MKVAVIGLGRMGRSLAERLLDDGHQVSVWNRSAGPAEMIAQRGARVMASADDINDESAVFLCLADDPSTLDVAMPGGSARPRWAEILVLNTGTVAPEVIASLAHAYGDNFVNAPILGAPQAVRSGAATFIVSGPAPARQALSALWEGFAGTLDVGETQRTAAVIKLLHNQMLLVEVAVIAETIRAGRDAGIDDGVLAATLRESALMPAGLRNRIDLFFDADHAGWFGTAQGAKDVGLFLGLGDSDRALPVTQAAHAAYRQVAQDGWATHDVTAVVEHGRIAPRVHARS